MHECALHNELSFCLEYFHNILIRFLDMPSNKVWDLTREAARLVNWTRWHLVCLDDTVGNGNAVIVFTEGGRLVDNTSTAVGCDIGVVKDLEGSVPKLLEVFLVSSAMSRAEQNGFRAHLVGKVREERLVSPAFHFCSGNGSELLVFGGLQFRVQSAK